MLGVNYFPMPHQHLPIFCPSNYISHQMESRGQWWTSGKLRCSSSEGGGDWVPNEWGSIRGQGWRMAPVMAIEIVEPWGWARKCNRCHIGSDHRFEDRLLLAAWNEATDHGPTRIRTPLLLRNHSPDWPSGSRTLIGPLSPERGFLLDHVWDHLSSRLE